MCTLSSHNGQYAYMHACVMFHLGSTIANLLPTLVKINKVAIRVK